MVFLEIASFAFWAVVLAVGLTPVRVTVPPMGPVTVKRSRRHGEPVPVEAETPAPPQ